MYDLNIQLVKWEFLDSSMGPKHKQEDYNEELHDCGICLVLFWTRFGDYTAEELVSLGFLKNQLGQFQEAEQLSYEALSVDSSI